MKKIFTILSLGLLLSCSSAGNKTNSCCDASDKNFKYEENWESLSKHNETPEWLQDAKFGIYLHWGLFNVPAFGSEWYPYNMYRGGNVREHHLKTYGEDFNYHDFAPMFKAEKFDPKDWAQLFKSSGAGFAGLCALHHDGYSLWDSEVNPWNAMDIGPERDVLGELFKEIKGQGMKTIATFHHARNLQRNADKPQEWADGKNTRCGYDSHFAYHPDLITASTDPKLAKMYGNMPADEFHKYWFDILKEVSDQYSPEIMWFDNWLNVIPEEDRLKFAAYYYNEGKRKNQEVTIAYKQDDYPIEVGINDIEEGGKKEMSERIWMTDVTICKGSWSYVKGIKYKTPDLVLRNMIDVWSKNGVVLLNIAPMADGTIPQEQRNTLTSIGEWLDKYGEAVHNTRPFVIHGFGTANTGSGHSTGQSASVEYTSEDVRFTKSKDGKNVYMFFLGKPKAGDKISLGLITPHRFEADLSPKRVTLLGTDIEAEYVESAIGATLTIPDAPMDEMATVFKFELKDK